MRALALPTVVSALLILGACDPEGPGARGLVSLGDGVVPGDFTALAMAAFPESAASFDPSVRPPAESTLYHEWVSLSEITFPYSYKVGASLGTTETPDWRVVIWLSRKESPDWLASGDVYGTAVFRVADCSFEFGDYCGVTDDVDVVIDQTAP